MFIAVPCPRGPAPPNPPDHPAALCGWWCVVFSFGVKARPWW